MSYIDVPVQENRRRKDDRADPPAIDKIPERRALFIPPHASNASAKRREEDEKDGQMQERDENKDPVPRDGSRRDQE